MDLNQGGATGGPVDPGAQNTGDASGQQQQAAGISSGSIWPQQSQNQGAAEVPAEEQRTENGDLDEQIATPHLDPSKKAASTNISEINRDFQEQDALRKAHELGMPYIDISKTPLNPDFFKTIPLEDVKAARIIPFFKVGQKLRVAIDNPANEAAKAKIQELQAQGFEIDTCLTSPAGLDDAIKMYDDSQQYKKLEIVETVEEKAIQTYEKEVAGLSDLPSKIAAVTAEEGLNMLNIGAMKTGSSDVHFEPEEDAVAVRFRIDGMLHKVFELDHELYRTLANQIKYESKMQLNLTTVPQDGRYSFNFNEQKVGVRVASIPTPFGESFVHRYLTVKQETKGFEELGFQGLALKKLEKATTLSQGMVLVTGPTGSGKSTTLYATLQRMNTPENKVITLEDPVEYPVDGVTQSQIDDKKGYNFSSGLRAILRNDPDVVMIGEIRDLETAETAIQAALTGHVLLSTLHTNSALESIPRLINMGLQPFMVAPALHTLVAQRLVRKVCPQCSTKVAIPESSRKEFEEMVNNLKQVNAGLEFEVPAEIPKVNGCDFCSNTGYKGRLVIVEVVTINAELKNLIMNNASMVDLIAAARKSGITTMREDGFMKVAQGLTTLEEVYRVTNVTGH